MANRNEPLCLRGEGERSSVSLAVLEQVLLVALQKLERDFARVLDAMPVAETDESAEVLSPAVDRRLRVVVNAHPEQVLGCVGFDRRHARLLLREMATPAIESAAAADAARDEPGCSRLRGERSQHGRPPDACAADDRSTLAR
jgi:hypothetical protein